MKAKTNTIVTAIDVTERKCNNVTHLGNTKRLFWIPSTAKGIIKATEQAARVLDIIVKKMKEANPLVFITSTVLITPEIIPLKARIKVNMPQQSAIMLWHLKKLVK